MSKVSRIEACLWSIAFPGFGQIVNRRYFKAVLFIILEILINMYANLNEIIILSFYGRTYEAISVTNYSWLMFYPGIYLFAIWDACRDAAGGDDPLLFVPFFTSSIMGTIGVIFSSRVKIADSYLGPVWLPLITIFVGAVAGMFIRSYYMKKSS